MTRSILGLALLPLFAATALLAQVEITTRFTPELLPSGSGHLVTPQSGLHTLADLGRRSQTQFKILVPAGRPEGVIGFAETEVVRNAVQPIQGYNAETPASLACLYALVSVTSGCVPGSVTKVATGGSKAIAIVDAYDYPTAYSDLVAYSQQFGLPQPTTATFTVAYQGASRPIPDPDCAYYGGWSCWASESALDIEMAHAMAPSAHIYLVEANSSSNSDLYAAVTKAVSLVKAAGGGEVSMSWGGGEYPTETQSDSVFVGTNVVFFASSGDSEGTIYPSASPNVVAVGGTTVTRNPTTMSFVAETAWEDTGGGFSPYEPRPAFQAGVTSKVGAQRGVPDVAAVGNPRTGVWVYNSFDNNYSGQLYAWNIFGGTSVASPLWAGIVNHAGHFSASTAAEETLIYANAAVTSDFRDINNGNCGYYDGYAAGSGWDPCSGVGAPVGTAGK
ncbi:MAG: S53 family peptidase [Terracidiphilus sp.]|jgi:subtilase family serine protease